MPSGSETECDQATPPHLLQLLAKFSGLALHGIG
jgi:hypothetical protein